MAKNRLRLLFSGVNPNLLWGRANIEGWQGAKCRSAKVKGLGGCACPQCAGWGYAPENF